MSQVVERTLPCSVEGVKQEKIVLNGDWQFQFSPKSRWATVQVPGELAMQGYAIEHDKPVLYKKMVAVPSDFANKQTILRFDGVYSYARLWVNGKYVGDHIGGFTRWECDVTKFVKTGAKNEIKLEVTDPKMEVSFASGYAHHPIGGILRDVMLYALPVNHLSNFFVETQLDSLYKDATLKVGFNAAANQEVTLKLTDGSGREIFSQKVNATAGENMASVKVKEPKKWDAEHPNLYTLKVSAEGYDFSRQVGFRDIKIVGNRMLVNGMAVKLRGACRHDIHPTLGRTTNRELDSLDADIFKRSNMNFVRTSHYPPTQTFLEFCDRVGLYVECETAICFVDTHRQKNYAPGNSQSDPAFKAQYMSMIQEMVTSFRSHASVLFWSVGNESVFGSNFQQTYDWVKATDKTRPAIFSYPGDVGKDVKGYDILSMHYPGVDGTLHQRGASTYCFQVSHMPSLFDEWAHVPCYTYTTLQDDPNIREFWGQSLDMMWSKLFDAQGGLGGAIWGYLDETFMLPEPKAGTPWWIEHSATAKPKDWQGKCVGYGDWGIVDVWRREKPEFWGTKKAYSPIRLMQTEVADFAANTPVMLLVYNRFDHTNLSEVTARFTHKGKSWTADCPDIAPHTKGVFVIPARAWVAGDDVFVEFLDSKKQLIDAYTVTLGTKPCAAQASKSGKLTMEDTDTQLIVKGDNFVIPFDKATGLIHNATSKGEVVIERGPFLNLDLNVNHNTGAEVRQKANNYIVQDADWRKEAFSYTQNEGGVRVALLGKYLDVEVQMTINISADGRLDIDYMTADAPNGWLREAGVKFYMPSTMDSVQWHRKGYWSYYPEGEMAATRGTAPLYNDKKVDYRQNPAQDWGMDSHDYYYFADRGANCSRPLTRNAKGMKENILNYTVTSAGSGLTVLSPGAQLSARLNKRPDEQLILYVNNRWDYPEIAWGDYCKALDVTPCYGKMTIQL